MEPESDESDIVVLGTMAPAGLAYDLYEQLKQHRRQMHIPLLVINGTRDEEWFVRRWRKFEGMLLEEADDYV